MKNPFKKKEYTSDEILKIYFEKIKTIPFPKSLHDDAISDAFDMRLDQKRKKYKKNTKNEKAENNKEASANPSASELLAQFEIDLNRDDEIRDELELIKLDDEEVSTITKETLYEIDSGINYNQFMIAMAFFKENDKALLEAIKDKHFTEFNFWLQVVAFVKVNEIE